jgi:hypothetical protein
VLVEPSAIGPLMRMYMMWGESTATKSKNWITKKEVAGIKTVTNSKEIFFGLS